MSELRILALNAFHGGSHAALLEGWERRSRHDFTTLTLPDRRWKWRMRHAAVTFAERVAALVGEGHRWDLVFATDMLNLAEFRGLVPSAVARLPSVVYFHENQLTYPVREERERDLHFGMTNLVSAAAADAVWWNSAYHRDEFLAAGADLVSRMPDFPPTSLVPAIRERSSVLPPGIDPPNGGAEREAGPLRIVWVGRWEHDKDPETFFRALERLDATPVDWRLRVLGESYAEVPEVFPAARERFADRIDHWGYAASRDEYRRLLGTSDVVVSTARHEFFGIAVVEAVAAGCRPLVPRNLAYPEVLRECDPTVFHDGTAADVASKLAEMAAHPRRGDPGFTSEIRDRFAWGRVAADFDREAERLVNA